MKYFAIYYPFKNFLFYNFKKMISFPYLCSPK